MYIIWKHLKFFCITAKLFFQKKTFPASSGRPSLLKGFVLTERSCLFDRCLNNVFFLNCSYNLHGINLNFFCIMISFPYYIQIKQNVSCLQCCASIQILPATRALTLLICCLWILLILYQRKCLKSIKAFCFNEMKQFLGNWDY